MKKLEGLFGLKLGEVFDETKFEVTKKELIVDDYWSYEIDWPPNPNTYLKDYSLGVKNDKTIFQISANTLSPLPFDEAKARQEDIANYFIETYFDSYAIYYYNIEHFMHVYEFIPYDSKIIPLRKDYRKFVHPNEPSKQLTITIGGESDNYKQVEILLELKEDDRDDEPSKIYEEDDIKTFDTGKGYEIDVTGL